ncbi:TIGR03915 family putative DNA repair protein [Lewinella cohaerens]|uniref:TIGR03915 family putative DNA repair protein n=1 Tax=Lewinella cohaerens TaxID=70995 RepID=UPI000360A55B|nr:TIGR03915 family putative DNA repair protein [Lewinella cohaerens]
MTFTYDGTFEGLLSVIFETYRLETTATAIVPAEEWQGSLFETPLLVATKEEWAERVKVGIKKKGGKKSLRLLEHCFLSEFPEVGKLIHDFVRKLMASPINISDNFGDDTVLKLHQIKKKIGREVHRMHAFVRFQRTQDDIYYAIIEPDFNVLPLLPDHFEKRYPAQHWLIYDGRRRYGIYYDQQQTEFVSFADDHALQYRQLPANMMAEQEVEYQVLWKSYFDSVNIKERKNPKLHLQHVPRRYWKYLSEKREQF